VAGPNPLQSSHVTAHDGLDGVLIAWGQLSSDAIRDACCGRKPGIVAGQTADKVLIALLVLLSAAAALVLHMSSSSQPFRVGEEKISLASLASQANSSTCSFDPATNVRNEVVQPLTVHRAIDASTEVPGFFLSNPPLFLSTFRLFG
jgi:hypothetical protein